MNEHDSFVLVLKLTPLSSMKKILAVLNQGQSLLNPVPSLDLIEIDSDLETEDQESIE